MNVARYVGNGAIQIVAEPVPECPPGGLLVKAEACGLCSGELMAWYMDRKIPHVLGHEVSGIVVESESERFPVGCRVFPHHHAPCLKCRNCLRGQPVHCEQWKRTRLVPGGMADFFAVSVENLTDTHQTDGLRPIDAALIEPLACVEKGLEMVWAALGPGFLTAAVVGLGSMGLLHLSVLPAGTPGYDLNPARLEWANGHGFIGLNPREVVEADAFFVCPGNQAAFDFAVENVAPGGAILMFAPLPSGEQLRIPPAAYFKELKILHSYSCGPADTLRAMGEIERGSVQAERICDAFISLSELPEHYQKMKRGEILKPMVIWS